MDWKVCILAAGRGTRMGKLAVTMNKAMLPINGKGVISYLIEKIPKEVEIVIAVGYLKEKLIEYVRFAHPDHWITFVDVIKYKGEGSGPGYSMLMCKDRLRYPFVHLAADTIVSEEVPLPDCNWMGVAPVDNVARFCSVKFDENFKIVRINDKEECDNTHAYIGALGVKDYSLFWDALMNNKTLIKGEIQVSNGSNALLNQELFAVPFTWFDTGTIGTFKSTEEHFAQRQLNEATIEREVDQVVYKLGNKTIEYYEDKDTFADALRARRVIGIKVQNIGNNMFSY